MSLLEKIKSDFKNALNQKDTEKINVLRLLLSSLHNKEIELKPKKEKLNEELVLETINREVKKHRESIEAFKKGNRLDLAEKEEKELKILFDYLPEQLSDDKIKEIVKAKIVETGATGLQDFGKVMGLVMKEVRGQVDGGKVGSIVREELNKVKK